LNPSGTSRDPVSMQDKLEFLRDPASYPDPTRSVEVRQTHMSCVFLTDRFVYKMKKPVKLAYLDFSTLESRRHFCLESLRLNRRLAAAVYLDVVPLTRERRGRLELAGHGEPVEWLERMLRLPDARMLDQVLLSGRDGARQAAPAARLMAAFYRRCPRLTLDPAAHVDATARAVDDNCRALTDPRYRLDTARVRMLQAVLQRTLTDRRDRFLRRVADGHLVEGHGDLRPEHVCLTDPPVVIDCLEFSRALRIVDPVDELAYLALECDRLGADLDRVLFDAYQEATGDVPPPGLTGFFKVHRAMLRAKLAVWHPADPGDPDRWLRRAEAYLHLAATHAERL
jgi:uncharacterized protein